MVESNLWRNLVNKLLPAKTREQEKEEEDDYDNDDDDDVNDDDDDDDDDGVVREDVKLWITPF